MQNQYLFLYPLRQYFEGLFGWRPGDANERSVKFLMRIINARYRDEGYDINWLVFGQDENLHEPNIGNIQKSVEVRVEDRLITAGIPYKDLPVDIDPEFVLGQLPPHERLVVGGFHQDVCVEKIAASSYHRGIDTFVDEDTTHKGIERLLLNRRIPLVRKQWTLNAMFGDILRSSVRDFFIRSRIGKPWLVQEIG